MNDDVRYLLRCVVDGNQKNAKTQARIILEKSKTAKDKQFVQALLNKLNSQKELIQLPYNLEGLLIAEDVSNFPISRFFIRDEENDVVKQLLDTYHVAQMLTDMGISYIPSLMLHGPSGCGKTMLARYIAYLEELPFIYLNLSQIVDSHLGKTASNISRAIEYGRENACVFCLDELDAIAIARGANDNDVGEMNRIVISLMQEFDRLPNDTIVIATTNRFDRIEPALVRRFHFKHEMKLYSAEEAQTMARMYFAGIGQEYLLQEIDLFKMFASEMSAASVEEICTNHLVSSLISGNNESPAREEQQNLFD